MGSAQQSGFRQATKVHTYVEASSSRTSFVGLQGRITDGHIRACEDMDRRSAM